jgi:plastocyanin
MQTRDRTTGKLLASSVALVLVVLGSAACNSSDPASCEGGYTSVEDTPVEMGEMYYRPDCIAAPSGGTIELDNVGKAPHTFTVKDTDVGADVGAGEQGSVALDGLTPGTTYTVICVYHPQMTARLQIGSG